MIINLKTFLATKFSILYYFYKQLGFKLVLTLLFNSLTVLMDGFGLTLFIPLLKIAGESVQTVDKTDKVTYAVQNFFSSLHLPLTVPVVLAFIILIFCFKGIFSYLTSVFQGITMAYFSRNLSRKNFSALNQLSYKAFVQSDFGMLQNTVSAEVYRVEAAAYQYIDTLKNIIIVIVYLGLSLVTDYKFSLMVIVLGLCFNYFYKFFYTFTRKKSEEVTAVAHDSNSLIMQSLYNFKYMKATNVIQLYEQRIFDVVEKSLHIKIAIAKINAFLQSIREPMMIIIVSIVILVQLVFFKTNIGSIIIILLFFYRSLANLLSLQTSWNNFLALTGSLENMQKFEKFLSSNQEVNPGTQRVERIENIGFSEAGLYFDSFKVLKDINLNVSKKETIAFVGESGSGKSTLINMLCGLYKAEEGTQTVNGQSISAVDMATYRSRIGYISQEPTIFSGSIYENVTLWAEHTQENMDRFWDAIEKSNLRPFIESLPDQENSLLGNSGINISGGQKQRISIARELFKDIDVLVMDEATSALDSETEREIQNSIDALDGELIILIIAHRFSTILNADRIVVMKAGHIEAVGTFEELKKKSEYFNKLANLQGL